MIKNVNHAMRAELCATLEMCRDTIQEAVQDARNACREHPSYDNWDAYVFRHLDECCDNANRYNQSLTSIIDQLNEGGEYAEPIEAWGEEWDETD